jgi:hypothetical protein
MKYFLRVLPLFILAIPIVGVPLYATVWVWGNQGHQIVAIIAADNLSPAASKHVAESLRTNSEVPSLESAMAAASLRPDTEFRDEDRSTAAWHFIDICLQDQQSDVPARCPDGNCATAKIVSQCQPPQEPRPASQDYSVPTIAVHSHRQTRE